MAGALRRVDARQPRPRCRVARRAGGQGRERPRRVAPRVRSGGDAEARDACRVRQGLRGDVAVRADDGGRRGGSRRLDEDDLSRRRQLHARALRPERALGHPRARDDGRGQRPRAARWHRQAVRVDVLRFTDYMRPSIRLSALMELDVVWVLTHDSVAVGEDGPTHQPIEHLAALRAIPGLTVIRPADANETVEAWRVALEDMSGPALLVLTRQDLPVLDGTREGLARGAYVLADGDAPDAVLVATGSEVWVALAARNLLVERGIRLRVV